MVRASQKSKTPGTSGKAPHPRVAHTLSEVLRGLQFKWTVLLTVFMLGLAIIGQNLIRRGTERIVAREQGIAAQQRCRILASAARQSLLTGDVVGLRDVVRPFEADSTILFVDFLDREGQPIVRAVDRAGLEPRPFGEQGPGPWLNVARVVSAHGQMPPYLDVVETSRLSVDATASNLEDTVGFVRLGIDLSNAEGALGAYVQIVRYSALTAVLMIIPVAFLIVRRVTEPLEALISKVTQLAAGDFQVRAEIDRRDEIGQLARAFNRMADELASKNDSLVKLNAELEDRVLQRTRQLVELASRDSLTGLYNRRHLGEDLARRFAEAERYDSDLSCLMIDLDNFKRVNDEHGHDIGDRLLMLTANVIKSELRTSDVGARFGGDEFCVLMPQTSAEQALQLGSRIVDRFQTEVKSQLENTGLDFGISVGVAGMQELKLVHYDELMKAADQALYGAKEAGKNRIIQAEFLVG